MLIYRCCCIWWHLVHQNELYLFLNVGVNSFKGYFGGYSAGKLACSSLKSYPCQSKMTLPAMHNTGVLYRRILSQFPQDISLAFAYGSGVFKQHGTNQGQMEVSGTCPAGFQTLPVKFQSTVGDLIVTLIVCTCVNKTLVKLVVRLQIKTSVVFILLRHYNIKSRCV